MADNDNFPTIDEMISYIESKPDGYIGNVTSPYS